MSDKNTSIETIKNSQLYIETEKICPDIAEKHKLFLTSYFGLTLSVAFSDGKIFKSELQYIEDTIPKGIDIDDKIKTKLVEVNISSSLLSGGFSTILPHYIHYLK